MHPPPALRPMTVIQILDAAFRLYRENFFLFLGIMAVPFVPTVVCYMAFMGYLFASMPQALENVSLPLTAALAGSQPVDVSHAALQQRGPSPAVLLVALGALGILMLIQFLVVPIAKGALTQAVSDRYLDRPATIGASYRAVLRIIFSYLLTTFLVGIILVVGFCLCLVPGIVLYTLFAFVAPIMILEGYAGTDAMGRSVQLTEGHRWRIIGLLAIQLLVGFGLGAVLNVTFDFVLQPFQMSKMTLVLLQQGLGQLIPMLLEPLWSVAWILLYYDVRIRKEAFDLQILAARTAPPQPA